MSHPIPQPPGIPLLGNVFDVNPNNTWASLKKLAEKYGEIFQIKVLGQTIVFVAGAALAEELCDETRFRKYVGGPIVEIRYSVHDALFTAYDSEPNWGVAHRIIAPKLTPEAVGERFTEVRDTAAELIEKWRGGSSDSGSGSSSRVALLDDLNRLNLEATTLTLFGKKLNCLGGPDHPMLQAMEDATSEAMKRPTRPRLANWLFFGGKFRRATGVMRSFAADLVGYRSAHPAAAQEDLLATLQADRDPESGVTLTESQVIDEIVTMPIGSSTAPCLVSTAVYLLLKNPEVIATARAELDAVVGTAGEFVHEHLRQLPYLEGVVRESLRLSFAAPGFNIEPIPRPGDTSPVTLGGGKYQVAHNQAVIIVLAGVNRDPTVFEDPLAFRPERMVGEAFDKLPAGVKKWFGNGKRECIGKHWAWQFAMTVLAKLLMDVDFALVDPAYSLEQDGWFNVRPVGFLVNISPRAR